VVSFFRDRSAASVFWVIILSIALHAHFFVYPPKVITSPDDGLLYYILQPLTVLPGIAVVVLYQIVLIIAALRLNYVLNDLRMFNRAVFTTAMAYILLSSLFATWNNLLPALIIHILLIWLFSKVARLYNNPHPKTLVYNIGLIAGCIQLLMPSLFTLPIFCLIGLALLRPPRPDEWIILIMGIFTPFYFLGVILFLNDNLAKIFEFFPFTRFHFLDITDKNTLIINLSLLAVFVLAGFIIWQQNTARMLIQSRRNWGVLIMLLLTMVPVIFVYKGNWIHIALIFILPISALASNLFFYPRRAFVPQFFFWITVAAVVYNNWFLR
jgi:hypothetical protein